MKVSKYMKVHWTPFGRASMPLDIMTEDRVIDMARSLNITVEETWEMVKDVALDEVWMNSLYQVNIRRYPKREEMERPGIIHLSIKRRDKSPVHDWRDMQRIKNELVGPEYVGLEIYPPEDELVDTANQYHIWVFDDPGFRLNFGFRERLISNKSAGGSIQRPRR